MCGNLNRGGVFEPYQKFKYHESQLSPTVHSNPGRALHTNPPPDQPGHLQKALPR